MLQEGSDEEPDVVDAHRDVENRDDDDNYAPEDDGWSDASSDDKMAVAQEMELGDTDSNTTENDERAASPAREEEEMIVEDIPLTSDSDSEEDAEYMHT